MNAKKILAVVLAVLMIVGVASGITVLVKGVSNEIYIPALEEEIPQEITFTLSSIEYTVSNGTTWEEFITSENYSGNLIVQDEYIFVYQSMGAYVYSTAEYGYEKVLATAEIEAKEYAPKLSYVSFTFGETAYRVERGTTWLEFIENNRTDENFANLYESDGNIYNSVSFYVLTYINGESYIAVSSLAVIDDLSYTLTNRSQLA